MTFLKNFGIVVLIMTGVLSILALFCGAMIGLSLLPAWAIALLIFFGIAFAVALMITFDERIEMPSDDHIR